MLLKFVTGDTDHMNHALQVNNDKNTFVKGEWQNQIVTKMKQERCFLVHIFTKQAVFCYTVVCVN